MLVLLHAANRGSPSARMINRIQRPTAVGADFAALPAQNLLQVYCP
jgi:hypothetical protein